MKLLTGGIDLPKLAANVADLRAAIIHAAQKGRPHLGPTATVADVIYWLRCRIDALDNLVESRALAEDVETLRLKLERRDDEFHSRTMVLTREIQELTATVAGLSAKVEALTAPKLSDVRSRKKAS
ncbi:hypothetical protein [Brevundimonas diminuta]|uniref:hypothetical protein n=1 Tax=Brevundimonas diminuta TaxID=293 RepID=UPI000FE1D96F|nr:hypothetical protein [Brevundimonas diminuta]